LKQWYKSTSRVCMYSDLFLAFFFLEELTKDKKGKYKQRNIPLKDIELFHKNV